MNRVASQSMAKVGGATPKGKFSALYVCALMQERLTPKIALSPLRQPAAVCARNENVLLGRNGCCGWVEPGSQVTPAAWLFWPGDRRARVMNAARSSFMNVSVGAPAVLL